MLSRLSMDVNFGGRTQSATGNVYRKSIWDAATKGLLTCFVAWVLAAFFVLVPFINWTLPGILLVFGPILGLWAYYIDRRSINRLDVETVCPECGNSFTIHESNCASPVYGNCPSCKAGYQLHLPGLEFKG